MFSVIHHCVPVRIYHLAKKIRIDQLACHLPHKHASLSAMATKSMSSKRFCLRNGALASLSHTPKCVKSSFFSFPSPLLLPRQIRHFRAVTHRARKNTNRSPDVVFWDWFSACRNITHEFQSSYLWIKAENLWHLCILGHDMGIHFRGWKQEFWN